MLYSFVNKNRNRRNQWLAGAAFALALGIAPAVHAQTQTFTFIGSGDSKVVTLTDNGGASHIDGYAGRYKGQLGAAPVTNIFCVDLSHEIHNNDTYTANTQYNITSAPVTGLTGNYYAGGMASALTNGDLAAVTVTQASARSSEVAWLADNYLNANSFSGASGSTDLTDNLTAINLSIWDIVKDGGDGINAGQMQAQAKDPGGYLGLTGYYEGLASSHQNYNSSTAMWIQAPQTTLGNHLQDYVYENNNPTPPVQAVPEPGMPTFLFCLSLVVGGLWLRLRRRQAVRA